MAESVESRSASPGRIDGVQRDSANHPELEGALTEADQKLSLRYKDWCRSAHAFEGDCLGGALVAGKYLDLQGRYMRAMALSKSPVLEEFEKALGASASMQAVMQAAMWTVVTLLVLLTMPEPVSKFVAAGATVGLIVWTGAQTLYNLITGWFQLMEEVKGATTFGEIRKAGENFGKLFSREAAQAFAMIAMALLTNTAKGFAEQVGTLPGSAQVSIQAARHEGILLSEVSAVEPVTVADDGFLVALPPGAVAMTVRGGPWTPLFEELFAKVGMRLKDPENIVPLKGHKGPHPRRYHEIVYERLQEALGDCRSIVECRTDLTRELRSLADEIAMPGTELNQLVPQRK
ncbi:hypothetical protein STIAU_3219 [Stigmatella aurantiaca DW4/3-1]|nr:hypothetical protein STIAU_3219 [Stigmatella aurantiaca DW4/3-1]